MSYEDLTCDTCGSYGDIICVDCKLVGWDYCYCEDCIEDHVCWFDVREDEAAQEGA
jgi:hypothetical protein